MATLRGEASLRNPTTAERLRQSQTLITEEQIFLRPRALKQTSLRTHRGRRRAQYATCKAQVDTATQTVHRHLTTEWNLRLDRPPTTAKEAPAMAASRILYHRRDKPNRCHTELVQERALWELLVNSNSVLPNDLSHPIPPRCLFHLQMNPSVFLADQSHRFFCLICKWMLSAYI
jgi:hypothetical protein